MKKVLALVVAFALCFTAIAGCFTTTAADADFAVAYADGVLTIDSEIAEAENYAILLKVTLPEDATVGTVKCNDTKLVAYDAEKENDDEFVFDYNFDAEANLLTILNVANIASTYTVELNGLVAAACNAETANEYTVSVYAEYADTVAEAPSLETYQGEVTFEVAKADHTAGEPVVENKTDATCTTDGSYDTVVYCSVCEAEVSRTPVTVPATGHTAGEPVEEDGYMVTYCTVCKVELSREEIKVECEHANAEWKLTNVTETHFEYDAATCPDCDAVNIEKNIAISSEASANIAVGRTIKPTNDIAIYFQFPKTATSAYKNLVLVVDKEVYDKNEKTPRHEPFYLENYFDDWYMGVLCDTFSFNNLAAYEMGNIVGAKLYGLDARGEMRLLKDTSYSVLEFINYQLAQNDQTVKPALKKTFVDILNYGAASQLLPDIMANTDNLVNANLTAAQKALGTQEYVDKYSTFIDVATAAEYNASASKGKILPNVTLAPESKVNMYFMMLLTNYNGDSNDLYCKFEFKNVMGEDDSVVVKYDGTTRNGYPAFKFDAAPISQLAAGVTATIYYGDPNAEGSEWMTRKVYSIESFIKSQIGNPVNEQVYTVLQTMYAYGYSMKYCVDNGIV